MTLDVRPFGSVVASNPLTAFTATYDATVYVAGRSASLPLTPISGTLSYDSRRSPFVTASIVAAWPTDTVLGYLDPVRQALSMAITATYTRLTTGLGDTQRLGLLRVQSVTRDYLAGTVTLVAASDEVIVTDQAATTTRSYTTASTVSGAIAQLIADALPGESPVVNTDAIAGQQFAAAASVAIGDDLWDAITDFADHVQAKVWHDGLGTWWVTVPPSVPSGSSSAVLNVGKKGTVTELSVSDSRDGWANQVIVRYAYTSGGTRHVDSAVATASLTPIVNVLVNRNRAPVDGARTAVNLLRRGLRRYHSVNVKALAAYWVRPWDVVSIRGPRGLDERALVTSVDFTLADGSMAIVGQAPVNEHLPRITSTITTTTP